MKRKYLILTWLPVLLFTQCNERYTNKQGMDKKKSPDIERSLPPVTKLSAADRTVFVASMEEAFTPGLNVVYTPAFLYAWEALRKTQHGRLSVPANDALLQQIHTSTSWKHTLDENEYEKEVTVSGDDIRIRTAFKHAIAFREPFDTIAGFTFRGRPVKGFGMYSYSDPLAEQIRILYYKDDGNFIVALRTKDDKDILLLACGFEKETQLSQLYAALNHSIQQGAAEMQQEHNAWKYTLNEGDGFAMPRLCFNIESAYTPLLDRIVQGEELPLRIRKATQRTALLLDEYGARVESEAEIVAQAAGAPPPVDKSRPKLLIFDKPFVVVMKKKAAAFPYFMMKVENSSLMTAR